MRAASPHAHDTIGGREAAGEQRVALPHVGARANNPAGTKPKAPPSTAELGRPDVGRLIEDEQHRSPLLTPQPQVIEHDRERLVAVREIADAENGRIGTVGDDLAGCGMLACPGLPLEQAQILDALRDSELARVV